MKNIIENNKIIAEFMNLNLYKSFWYKSNIATEKKICKENNLKFHSDWNWLMEVVEKIESLEHWTETLGGLQNICLIGSINSSCESFKAVAETKIEAVYNACLEFIQWYNEQNKVS